MTESDTDDSKPLRFVASARKDLRAFPADARQIIGHDFWLVERGEQPRDFKPMRAVGKGVEEVRARAEDGQYRAFYIARFPEAVYVLHAFQKKTQETSQHDIEKGQRRLKRLKKVRKQKGLG